MENRLGVGDEGGRQSGAEREADAGGRKNSLEAIASVLSSGSENPNQAVIWRVMEGTEPRNSLQVEMEGHDHGFTWGEQQMEAQRMTSSHLPFVNCFVSLKAH